MNRMIFVPVIATITIAAMTATIPVITMPQIAKADTNCSQTYLTQQERYNCGYNRGYIDAQRDWNLHRFPPGSGGDNSCPHAKEHTLKYCNGYQIGYTTSWNTRLNQGPNPSTNYTSPTPTKFLEYENSTYGIKMQYPSDWRVEGAGNSSIITSFYPQRDNVSKVTVQIENLTTNFTPDQYLNNVIRGYVANYKDFPDINFTSNTTSIIVLSDHPAFFLNGTFRDPVSGVLDEFTNIGTIIGGKAYSVIFYSPAQTYTDYSTTYSQMIGSFEVTPTQSHPGYETQPSTPKPNLPPTTSNPPITTNPSTELGNCYLSHSYYCSMEIKTQRNKI